MAVTRTDSRGHVIVLPTFTTGYTNLGPLPPTSFPADCLENLWDMNTPYLGGTLSYQTQGCGVKSCCPSGNFYTEAWAWMTSYYSPGECPSQYRSCVPPQSPTPLSSEPGEKIVFCCPTNYGCPSSAIGDIGIFIFCQSAMSRVSTRVIVLDNLFNQKTVSTRPFVIQTPYDYQYQLAYPIQIRTRTDSTVSTSTSTISAQTNTPPVKQNHAGLSPGAIAGISIGTFIAVGSFVLGVLYLIYRIRSIQSGTAVSQNPNRQGDNSELDTQEASRRHHMSSLEQGPPAELPTYRK